MSLLFFLKPNYNIEPEYFAPDVVPEPDKKKKRKRKRIFEVKKKRRQITAEEVQGAKATLEALKDREMLKTRQEVERAAKKIRKQLDHISAIADILDYLEDIDYEL